MEIPPIPNRSDQYYTDPYQDIQQQLNGIDDSVYAMIADRFDTDPALQNILSCINQIQKDVPFLGFSADKQQKIQTALNTMSKALRLDAKGLADDSMTGTQVIANWISLRDQFNKDLK